MIERASLTRRCTEDVGELAGDANCVDEARALVHLVNPAPAVSRGNVQVVPRILPIGCPRKQVDPDEFVHLWWAIKRAEQATKDAHSGYAASVYWFSSLYAHSARSKVRIDHGNVVVAEM